MAVLESLFGSKKTCIGIPTIGHLLFALTIGMALNPGHATAIFGGIVSIGLRKLKPGSWTSFRTGFEHSIIKRMKLGGF